MNPGRWLKFGTIGLAGTLVQLGVLWILAKGFRMPALLATAIAVEIALLHNFAWHEAWTWRGLPPDDRWRRLLRFHSANGFVSLAATPLFTWLFVSYFSVPLLMANLAAVGVTGLLNYVLADRWVFRGAA